MRRMLVYLFGVVGLAAIVIPSGVWAQQASAPCRLSTPRGAFGFIENGTISGFGAYAAVGTIISDGAGGMSGIFTESAAGAIGTVITFSGTYDVNADCTGTAELTDSLGRTGTRAFVIVDQGREIQYLFTDPGFVATGVAKKQ